jgi:hypothetical protein
MRKIEDIAESILVDNLWVCFSPFIKDKGDGHQRLEEKPP